MVQVFKNFRLICIFYIARFHEFRKKKFVLFNWYLMLWKWISLSVSVRRVGRLVCLSLFSKRTWSFTSMLPSEHLLIYLLNNSTKMKVKNIETWNFSVKDFFYFLKTFILILILNTILTLTVTLQSMYTNYRSP